MSFFFFSNIMGNMPDVTFPSFSALSDNLFTAHAGDSGSSKRASTTRQAQSSVLLCHQELQGANWALAQHSIL